MKFSGMYPWRHCVSNPSMENITSGSLSLYDWHWGKGYYSMSILYKYKDYPAPQ